MGVGLSSALQISASVHFAAEWADFGRGGEDVADLGPRPDRLAVSPPVLGGRRRETSLGAALFWWMRCRRHRKTESRRRLARQVKRRTGGS
jgi:hypothetical protein